MEKLTLIWEKLKREWKSFTLQIGLFLAGAWELAVSMGADLPSLFSFIPEEYRSWVLFIFAGLMLAVRKYTPTTVVVQAPEEPKPSDTPTVK